MKKEIYYIITIIIISILLFTSKVLAYSDEFILLLETMDIPKENVLGKKINEEVYNEYKLFVYGSPLENHKGQRWKNVVDGKWSKDGGAWSGNGIRGEYWILGSNYNGKEVHNHKFPVDIEPPTQPTEWRYVTLPDALESWQETEKYMDDVQKEYMLTQNLMRNNTTYDLTVQDIGFEKVRIENYATWKTKGTVYTQRYDMNNKKWAANFMVQPMAGEAKLEGFAQFPDGDEYTIAKETKNVSIPIVYGSQVVNLTEYAKKEHVKEIKSQLYVNGEYIDEVIDKKVLSINKEKIFDLDLSKYQEDTLIILNVEIKSTLFTTFITDGALVDVKNYTLYVYYGDVKEETKKDKYIHVFDEEYREFSDFQPPQITSIEIKRVVNNVEADLLISKKTGKEFICAGQTIIFEIKAINIPEYVSVEFEGDSSIKTLDNLTKLFEWTEPKQRNIKTIFKKLEDFEDMYNEILKIGPIRKEGDETVFECMYVIPYKTKQTLHSWDTLRIESNDAFEIDEKKLFSRISSPYEIVFKVNGPTGVSTERVKLDVFERWDTLYNRDLSKYVR